MNLSKIELTKSKVENCSKIRGMKDYRKDAVFEKHNTTFP